MEILHSDDRQAVLAKFYEVFKFYPSVNQSIVPFQIEQSHKIFYLQTIGTSDKRELQAKFFVQSAATKCTLWIGNMTVFSIILVEKGRMARHGSIKKTDIASIFRACIPTETIISYYRRFLLWNTLPSLAKRNLGFGAKTHSDV